MSRHEYKGATPETVQAVKDFIKEVAFELDVTDKYLYAILAGKEPDPFARFKFWLRAVARKNPAGARLYLATLTRILRESNPQPESGRHAFDATYHDLKSVLARREDGLVTEEQVQAARERHAEATLIVGAKERDGIEATP